MYVRLSKSNDKWIFSSNPTTITPINNAISFAPPMSRLPGNKPCEIVATENQHQLRLYIQSLQKLLCNFAPYCFHCQLTIEVYGPYLGQTHVWMVLRKTKTGITSPHLSVSYSTKGATEKGCDRPGTASPYRSACWSSW